MTNHAPRVQVPEVLKRRKCFLHIDLEQIRLGLTADTPLVAQQWNAIIAVSYSARKFGITRLHHNVFDAKQLCPELVCAHVATLGPGDSQPDYYPSPSRYTHKVSLDPYRKASANIFAVFRKFCPKYQKGGQDEVFMDVTDIVNKRIMDEYGADLSKWDPEAAESINWKRDHPEAGVIFGAPREGDALGDSSVTYLDDDEDEDGYKGEGLDGIKTEESEHDMDSGDEDNENEPEYGDNAERVHVPEDDFDLDLEQYIDSDFDETTSFSHPGQTTELDNNDLNPMTQSKDTTVPVGTVSISDTGNPAPHIEEKSEEELRREKEAEEERLHLEKELLLPYYGIPDDTFEEEFWAEMQLLKAAEFCNEVRSAVKEELGYTCSAGIGNNKLVAKLGSGMNKPFNQTIVLPKYVPDLLHGLKLSKIRNLGGKFGKQVKEDYKIERASQLWPIALRQLQQRYGEQAGLELWQWCRGIDNVGIRKVKSKSMCSHKSFIPALSDMEEIQFWISSMSLELVSRIQAEYDETERWPRTVSLGFYGGRWAKQEQEKQNGERATTFRAPTKGSRSMPLGSRFEYGGVEGIARKMYIAVERLIREAEAGRGRPILPLVLLTITVSNFSNGQESAMGDITKFFSKAPIPAPPQQERPFLPAYQIKDEGHERVSDHTPRTFEGCELEGDSPLSVKQPQERSGKPLEASETAARRRFFQPRTIARETESVSTSSIQGFHVDHNAISEVSTPSSLISESHGSSPEPQNQEQEEAVSSATTTLLCDQCPSPGQRVPIDEWECHADYHFALSLLEDDRKQQQVERQQQQHQLQQANSDASHPSGASNGGKRGAASSASSTPSTRVGKRKKAASSSTSSSTAAASPSSTPLAKFFKPSAN